MARVVALVVAALAGVLAAIAWFIIMPHMPLDVPVEVARAQLTCGDLLLTQTFTRTSDPYKVWLYFRERGAQHWTRYFVDFEAPYWRGGFAPERDSASLNLYGREIGGFACKGREFVAWGHSKPALQNVLDPFAPDAR